MGMKKISFSIFFTALLVFCNSACSNNNSVEKEIKLPYTNISADEAKRMIEDGGKIVAADTKSSYINGHIKGSILIKDLNDTDRIYEKLPDKEQVVLVYSHHENKAINASEDLSRLGYTNVYSFGKLSEWTGEFIDEYDNVYYNLLGGSLPPKEKTSISRIIRKKINRNLPKFTFTLIGEHVKKYDLSDDETAYTAHAYMEVDKISKIIITEPKGNFKQTLKFDSTSLRSDLNYPNKFGFTLDDFNFDGYLDIELCCYEGGSMRNRPCYYWLWDIKKEKFIKNKDLEEMSWTASISTEKKDKRISVYTRVDSSENGTGYFIFENGRPVMVEFVNRRYKRNGISYAIQKRINGKMKTVKKYFEKSE